MLVKDLKRELKDQYTHVDVYNINHTKATPYTQLGKRFNNLSGKALINEIDKSEVAEYKLTDYYDCLGASFNDVAQGNSWKHHKARILMIYIK